MGKLLQQGILQIYTGDGKGKTTAAFGLALRAAGHGFGVSVVQFMKTVQNNGELAAINNSSLNINVEVFGVDHLVKKGAATEEDIQQAANGLQRLSEILKADQADIVIADELCNAIYFDLLSLDEVLEVIALRSATTELILTGRNAAAELRQMADLVTEMREIKHPYAKGVFAREGIEF